MGRDGLVRDQRLDSRLRGNDGMGLSSRRSVTARAAAVRRGHDQNLATPTTTDPPHRRPALAGVVYIAERLCHSQCRSVPPDAARSGVLCVELRSPRPGELRREDGTNAFWPLTRSRFSYGQFTRLACREQGKLRPFACWAAWRDPFLFPLPLGEDRGEGDRSRCTLTLPSPKGRG